MPLNTHSSFLLRACYLLILSVSGTTKASPVLATTLLRRGPLITYDGSGHIQNVTDATTGLPIPQASATDGCGVDFDVSAIIWLAWSLAVGVPLMLIGIRVWRFTTGTGVGLAVLVCIWAAFVNALNANGISDILLTLIVLGGFLCGFAIGLFNVGRMVGVACLSILGGISIGVRIVLFRPGLLVHSFGINWLIIAICGVISFVTVLLRQRVAITLSSAAAGTFLTSLGVDLLVNKQSGMSFGLRYLFDCNSTHLQYLSSRGWHPPIVTEVVMGISLGLIPILAYAQHVVFKSPFHPVRGDYMTSHTSIDFDAQDSPEEDDTVPSLTSEKTGASEQKLLDSVPALPSSPVDRLHPPDTPISVRTGKEQSSGFAV